MRSNLIFVLLFILLFSRSFVSAHLLSEGSVYHGRSHCQCNVTKANKIEVYVTREFTNSTHLKIRYEIPRMDDVYIQICAHDFDFGASSVTHFNCTNQTILDCNAACLNSSCPSNRICQSDRWNSSLLTYENGTCPECDTYVLFITTTLDELSSIFGSTIDHISDIKTITSHLRIYLAAHHTEPHSHFLIHSREDPFELSISYEKDNKTMAAVAMKSGCFFSTVVDYANQFNEHFVIPQGYLSFGTSVGNLTNAFLREDYFGRKHKIYYSILKNKKELEIVVAKPPIEQHSTPNGDFIINLLIQSEEYPELNITDSKQVEIPFTFDYSYNYMDYQDRIFVNEYHLPSNLYMVYEEDFLNEAAVTYTDPETGQRTNWQCDFFGLVGCWIDFSTAYSTSLTYWIVEVFNGVPSVECDGNSTDCFFYSVENRELFGNQNGLYYYTDSFFSRTGVRKYVSPKVLTIEDYTHSSIFWKIDSRLNCFKGLDAQKLPIGKFACTLTMLKIECTDESFDDIENCKPDDSEDFEDYENSWGIGWKRSTTLRKFRVDRNLTEIYGGGGRRRNPNLLGFDVIIPMSEAMSEEVTVGRDDGIGLYFGSRNTGLDPFIQFFWIFFPIFVTCLCCCCLLIWMMMLMIIAIMILMSFPGMCAFICSICGCLGCSGMGIKILQEVRMYRRRFAYLERWAPYLP